MKVLKNIVIAAALFIIIGQFLPSLEETRVSLWISGSKEDVYKLVANWREWHQWSTILNAPSQYTYEGPQEGVGAQQISALDSFLGQAYWNIIKADPEIGITYYCVFINKSHVQSALIGEMTFETQDNKTKVTWIERTEIKNIVAKWIYFILGSMLQNDMMSDNLAGLKRVIEKAHTK